MRELSDVCRIVELSIFLTYLLLIIREAPRIMRSRTLVPADDGLRNRTITYRVRGQRIVLHGSLFPGAREIYGREVYFAWPGFDLARDDTVVDIGANAGVFTVEAAKLARHVVAIEAQSEFVKLIQTNAERNGCADRIRVEFGLVGPASGVFSDQEALLSADHYGDAPPILSMRNIVERQQLARIDFLKVDIEGSEFALFAEDLEWLDRVRRIAMEVHPDFGDVQALEQTLRAHGMTTRLLDAEQRPAARLSSAGYLFAWRG